jgi:hypothetical protein
MTQNLCISEALCVILITRCLLTGEAIITLWDSYICLAKYDTELMFMIITYLLVNPALPSPVNGAG